MVEYSAGARRDIAARVGQLGRELSHMAPRDQMRSLLSIKAFAQAHCLTAVASLMHALEGELLAHGAEAPFRAYLDQIPDVVDVGEEALPRFVELSLATLGAGLAFA